MSDNLSEDLEALEFLDLDQLRELWQQRWCEVPKLRSAELMRLQTAWRMQAEVAGGLDELTRRQLKRTGRIQAEGLALGPGSRLRREWQGETVEVIVEEGGFRCGDRVFKSLSAAATAIAGTRWNGPRFFGLRQELR